MKLLFALMVFLGTGCDCKFQKNQIEINLTDGRNDLDCSIIEFGQKVPELIWKQPFTDELASSIKPIIADNNIIYSISHASSPKDKLVALNIMTGMREWIWENTTSEFIFHLGSISRGYLHNGSLIIGSRGVLYSIDYSNGQSNYHIVTAPTNGNDPIYINGNKAYMRFEKLSGDQNSEFIAEIDLQNQQWTDIYSYSQNDESSSSLKLAYPIKYNQKDYVLISNNLSTNNAPVIYKFIILLVDLDTKQIAWETTVDGFGTIFNKPILYKGSVFVCHSSIYRLDLNTGSILWERAIDGGVGFTGMIMADGKLVIGTEGLKPMHHALNPDTGELLWSTSTTGTASTMEYHNCVVYFTGGGDGKLHALNANTGEHLYILTSPDYAQNSNLYFGNSLTIDKSTNRLYTHNWYNALCYQLPEY